MHFCMSKTGNVLPPLTYRNAAELIASDALNRISDAGGSRHLTTELLADAIDWQVHNVLDDSLLNRVPNGNISISSIPPPSTSFAQEHFEGMIETKKKNTTMMPDCNSVIVNFRTNEFAEKYKRL